METDVNVPKTKGVNISYQNIKFNLYVIIMLFVARALIQEFYLTAAPEKVSLKHLAASRGSAVSFGKAVEEKTEVTSATTDNFQSEITFINTAFMGSIVFLLINLVGLFYIWFRKTFARMEFWVLYGFNLVWSGLLVLQGFNIKSSQIVLAQIAAEAVVFLAAKKELEILSCFVLPMSFTQRQLNVGSTLLFPYLFYII